MKKLFWEDPYLTECKAKVTEINGNRVKLDQSVFFAFSGGQASDSGTIGGIPVTEAVKQGDKEDIIDIEYHLEKEPSFKVGDEVEVKIDKKRRLALMKLHSAIHIAYYFLLEKIGKQKIIGSNIHPDKARMDFEYPESLKPLIPELEEKTNSFLEEGHEILRKPDEKRPNLLWWICGEWRMPCGGTHVLNTKEIGKIKLKRNNIGSGKERIELKLA